MVRPVLAIVAVLVLVTGVLSSPKKGLNTAHRPLSRRSDRGPNTSDLRNDDDDGSEEDDELQFHIRRRVRKR